MDALVVPRCLVMRPIVVVMVHMVSVMIVLRIPLGVAVVATVLVPLLLLLKMPLGTKVRLLPLKLVLLVGEVAIKIAMCALTLISRLVMVRGGLVMLDYWSLFSRIGFVLAHVLPLQSILPSLLPSLVGTLLLLVVHLLFVIV